MKNALKIFLCICAVVISSCSVVDSICLYTARCGGKEGIINTRRYSKDGNLIYSNYFEPNDIISIYLNSNRNFPLKMAIFNQRNAGNKNLFMYFIEFDDSIDKEDFYENPPLNSTAGIVFANSPKFAVSYSSLSILIGCKNDFLNFLYYNFLIGDFL